MTKLVLIEGGAAKAPEPMPAELYVLRFVDESGAFGGIIAAPDPQDVTDRVEEAFAIGLRVEHREPEKYVLADSYTVQRVIDLKMRLLDLRAALAGSRDATSQAAREALVTRALEADFEHEKGGA